MKVKKVIAFLSAITMMCTSLLADFPIVNSGKHIAHAVDTNVVSEVNVDVSANNLKRSSETTDGWLYSAEDDEVTITAYIGSDAKIKIPSEIAGLPVVRVDSNAFSDNKTITSVDLGNVTSLGYSIFSGCTNLKEITIPKTVTDTGEYWNGCLEGSSIETVIFEEGIEKIPAYVCMNASKVKNVIIPEKEDTVDGYTIEDSAFRGTAITSISIPESVTDIQGSVFRDCALLTEITIPNNVNYIGSECFAGCKRLSSLDLGTNVGTLGYSIISECPSIKEITIPKSVNETGEYWNGCLEGSSVETVIFEEGIEKIPAYVCMNASKVKNVVIPEKEDTVDGYTIEDSAFRGTAITSISIPESVTDIQGSAFRDCVLLTSVTIPNNVNYIGSECFAGCKRLAKLDLGKNVSTLGYSIISECPSIKEITIPKSVKETGEYWNGCLEGSSVETVIFEEGIEKIPAFVCLNASKVKNIVIPEKEDTVDGYTIEDSAFRGTAITSISIPESVTDIQGSVFRDCAMLTEITIPNNVNYIGSECFAGCKRLAKLDLGTNVSTLGYSIISECPSIKEITIPKSVNETGEYWNGCLEGSSIETVIFEEGIEKIPAFVCLNASKVKNVIIPEKEDTVDGYTIEDSAFRGTAITSISIPESVTDIQGSAFRDCVLLTSVTIPNNVNYIGSECFAGCKRLSSLDLGTNVGTLGYSLVSECVSLRELTIPKTVKETGEYWNGCLEGSSIETLILKDGMKTVPEYIAMNCESLKTVYLADTITTIGNYAFSGCSNLERVKSTRSTFNFSSHSFAGCIRLDDKRFTVLDMENTYLIANSGQESVNGLINYTLKYRLMPSIAAGAEDISLHLNIPEGMTLMLDSVQSKNLSFDAEQLTDGMLELNSAEGEIRFSARIVEVGNYEVSATLNFYYNDSDWKQIIGRTDVECPDLTLAVPEFVNEPIAEVYGLAARGDVVSIYVNDKLADTLTANSYTGKYKGKINLPTAVDGETYSIYAECGDIKTPVYTAKYSSEKPVIKKVMFSFNGNEDEYMDITDVLEQGVSPVISYNPAYPTTFEITATHNDKIDRMFVTSTKGDNTKYIEAYYDDNKGTWIASGYFDPENQSYVPGKLNISTIEKEVIILDDNYNYDEDQYIELPKEYLDNSSVEIISESDDAFLANVNISNGITTDTGMIYSGSNDQGLYINGTYHEATEIAKNPSKYGFTASGVQTIENGRKVTYYTGNVNNDDAVSTLLDFSKDLSDIKSVWTGKAVLKMVEGDAYNEPLVQLANTFVTGEFKKVMKGVMGESYSAISNGLSLGSDIFKYAAELQMADGNFEYQAAATVLFAVKCFNTFGGTEALLAAVGIEPPLSTVIKFGIGRTLDQLDSYLMYCIKNNQKYSLPGFLRFIIDPSGIVYEAVLGNTLDGVTVTIYFKDPDTGETIKWNAEDYDQINPIVTGENGEYLWDVPEGLWKVVCEKEGYDKVETDWMDVPPVRTEVNIAMVNKDEPVIESAEMNDNEITVKFSKFIDISSVTSDSIILSEFDGTFDIAAQVLDEDDVYADTFVLTGDFTSSIKTIEVTADIKSYAGITAQAAEFKIVNNNIIKGDVNGDGVVNMKDAVLIRRYLADGWNVEINTDVADVNGDGSVNMKDVVLIRRYNAGDWGVAI